MAADAEQPEETAPEDPSADQGLADDANAAPERPHESDLELGAVRIVDARREQHEPVEAQEATVARTTGGSARLAGTRDYRMTTADARLRGSIEGHGHDRILTLDPAFQGLPEAAHGGSVLAAFDVLAGLPHPREVTGLYRRRVPLGVPLRLALARDGAVACGQIVDDSGAVLVEGGVAPATADVAPGEARAPAGHQLPVSATCFACGVENTLGLQARLGFDKETVGGRWEPRPAFRADDGMLAPLALTTLLDEAAFWLGALATGESGMTTDLRVTLHRPCPFGAPITVAGARADVRPRADDPRYLETTVTARDEDGGVVATAAITFVAVRGAARRLVGGLLAMNAPGVVRRVFPAYTR